jgi:hypothetical protein
MDNAEYERRRDFCAEMKTMNRSECIEVARILREKNVPFSENRSGLYFDLAILPQEVFDSLVNFRDFVKRNSKELDKRNEVVSALQRPSASK